MSGDADLDAMLARYGALDDELKAQRERLKPARAEHKLLKERIADAMRRRRLSDAVDHGGRRFRVAKRQVKVKPDVQEQVARAASAMRLPAKRARKLVDDLNSPVDVRTVARLTCRKLKSGEEGARERPPIVYHNPVPDNDDDDGDQSAELYGDDDGGEGEQQQQPQFGSIDLSVPPALVPE